MFLKPLFLKMSFKNIDVIYFSNVLSEIDNIFLKKQVNNGPLNDRNLSLSAKFKSLKPKRNNYKDIFENLKIKGHLF